MLIAVEETLLAADLFYGHGYDSAHDEAVALVLAASGLPVDTGAEILDQPFPQQAGVVLAEWLNLRTSKKLPVAYITGRAWLGPLEFLSDHRALVPRSPIMELVLGAFAPWWQGDDPSDIIDVCCGGGSLGILAAAVFENSRVILSDIDQQALALAQANIDYHSCGHRVFCAQGDLLSEFGDGVADVILANPPYVDALDMSTLPAEYLHEPRHALAAGEDGLDLVHTLLVQSESVLRPGGLLFLEVGNSWEAMEAAYPAFPFVWVELSAGGHGVTVLSKEELSGLIERGKV